MSISSMLNPKLSPADYRAALKLIKSHFRRGAEALLLWLLREFLDDPNMDDGRRRKAALTNYLPAALADASVVRAAQPWLSALGAAALRLIRGEILDDGRLVSDLSRLPVKQRVQVQRAALVWDTLATVSGSTPYCDAFCRWQSLPDVEEDAIQQVIEAAEKLAKQISTGRSPRAISRAIRLAAGIEQYFAGRRYAVLFPVVSRKSNESYGRDNSHGNLLWARVTLLPRPTAFPSVILAPWSPFSILGSSTVAKLGSLLTGRAMRQKLGLKKGSVAFMIELDADGLDARGLNPPRNIEVEGESLSLSVALAAWAANRRRHLKPLAASAELAAIDGGVKLSHVADLDEKYEAVAKVAKRGKSIQFVVSAEDVAELPAQRTGVDVVGADTWEDLTQPEDLLTDGFDDFRNRLAKRTEWGSLVAKGAGKESDTVDEPGKYLKGDQQELDALAKQLVFGETNEQEQVFCLPYDNDPRSAAKFLCRAIARYILKRTKKPGNESFPVEHPVPVWLPMADMTLPPDENLSALVQRSVVTRAIEGALQSMDRELCVGKRTQWIVQPDVIRNTVGFVREKLLLIAYSNRSSQLDFALESKRIAAVRQFLKEQPEHPVRLLFVASDLAHKGLYDSLQGEDGAC